MQVAYCGSEFEIPDILIDKYTKDFDTLPGSGQRESIMQLRMTIDDILDYVAEEPDMLHEKDIMAQDPLNEVGNTGISCKGRVKIGIHLLLSYRRRNK